MPFYTPLRYPGGKRRLADAVIALLGANRLTNIEYAEPYAGGAAIGLALLFGEHAASIHINDLSRPVFAFWHSVLNDTDELCRRVDRVRVTMAEWDKQRAVLDKRETADLTALGFATLFLNRTNRSGIIGGGVIGGKDQKGKWKLDARFTKKELTQRIRRVSRYKNRIHLYQQDAVRFTADVVANLGAQSLAFYDPPYVDNGQGLYLNDYDLAGHQQVARCVTKLAQPWVVTYDYGAVTAGLYARERRVVYGLSYSAQSRYEGQEVMFLSNRINLPDSWRPRRLLQLNNGRSDYPFYGRLEDAPQTPAQRSRRAG